MTKFFWKFSAKSTEFEVSSLGLDFQVSVSEFLMKSRSRSFNQVSVSKVTVSTTSLVEGISCQVFLQPKLRRQRPRIRAGAFQRPRQDPFFHFQRPIIAYDIILLNQPWHDLFKRKQIHYLCSLYIFNFQVHPRQDPFHHPSTQKKLLRTIFLHQTNLFDACRVYLNTKFIVLSIQVTGVTAFT